MADKYISVDIGGGRKKFIPKPDLGVGDKALSISLPTGKVFLRATGVAPGLSAVAFFTSTHRIFIEDTGIGHASAVDPCQSLTLSIDPDDQTKILIQWVPGANNDYVHYEMDTDIAPNEIWEGEEHGTLPVSTTQTTESILKYNVWHYVTIWGKRNGLYSSVALTAGIFVNVDVGALTPFCSCHITRPANSGLPQSVGVPFIDYDPTGALEVGEGTREFSFDRESGTILLSGSSSSNIATWADDRVRATQLIGKHSGESVLTGMNSSLNSILNFGDNMLEFDCVNTTPILISWGIENNGLYPWTIFDTRQPYLILTGASEHSADSWDLYGDDDPAPAEEHNSGVSIVGPGQSGHVVGYERTILFHDGLGVNAYIAIRVHDPDNAIAEIYAVVVEDTRPKMLFFGDTELASNIEGYSDPTYHGYLSWSSLF